MSAHLLATAIVALAGLKLAGAAGSLYVTVLMRRALTHQRRSPPQVSNRSMRWPMRLCQQWQAVFRGVQP